MNTVELQHVIKKFGAHTAVDDLSLSVPHGSIYGFIGPNGSGKSTTLRMILHIILPDSGRIEVLGKTMTRAANDRIGYLPEERGLYKKMTVIRQLVYFGQLKGMAPRAARQAALEWLDRLELSEWPNKKTEALSKGMAQKVQFIASVIANPQLLILDEPFSGLDPVNLQTLRDVILELKAEGRTIIFSTHDMYVAERMCDSIFMIYRGRKVLDGSLADVQRIHGDDAIRIKIEGGATAIRRIIEEAGLDGLQNLTDYGDHQELRYQGDPHELLRLMAAQTPIHHFEIARPSLHDIFLRIARPSDADLHGSVTGRDGGAA